MLQLYVYYLNGRKTDWNNYFSTMDIILLIYSIYMIYLYCLKIMLFKDYIYIYIMIEIDVD